ncbi:SGNH/GDSL hydrolase family protein [Rhodococcus sp. NM-2]|uniref:SGNH/GDSL hydrolase family protein n=1 Tax=Rhodococcus sp. NM-2 TaxID=3401174 RepID=UPI003AAE6071
MTDVDQFYNSPTIFPLSAFNLRPDNMRKWRAARGRAEVAKASAGTCNAHITCIGDSITYGANATGVSSPKSPNSWPGRLRRMMDAQYSAGGSGVAMLWDTLTTYPTHDPRWTKVGTIEDRVAGAYNHGNVRWLSGSGDANYVTFTADCTEFWIYSMVASSTPRVQVDGGTIYTIAGALGQNALTNPDPLSGYQNDGSFGQLVTVIPAGVQGTHTLKIMAPSNGTSYMQMFGVRARTGKGVEVSNLGYNGISTSEMTLDNTTTGISGMAVGLDMMRADLSVMLLSMNDFQTHTSVATFKSRVTTLVQRQKSSDTYRANGDVLLVACPRPDFANIPLDHVQSPPLSDYHVALYEVAVEQDVPLLDLAHRWTDFSTSNPLGYYADSLHPTDLGAEDIARAVWNVLHAV